MKTNSFASLNTNFLISEHSAVTDMYCMFFGKVLVFLPPKFTDFLQFVPISEKKTAFYVDVTLVIYFLFYFYGILMKSNYKMLSLVVLIVLFGPLCRKMPGFGPCFNVKTPPLLKPDFSEFTQTLARYRVAQFF